MKIYTGTLADPKDPLSETTVLITDETGSEPLKLAPSLAVRNHSPTGFSWGYGGSGPAQLSLALLVDFFGDSGMADDYYHEFMWAKIACLRQGEEWTLTEAEITRAIQRINQHRFDTAAG